MRTRVSTYFKLGRKQPSLDFVDVSIKNDARVFIDPRALRLLPSQWACQCVSLIQSFFKTLLSAIKANDERVGRILLSGLHEPNETHLGLSRGQSQGRGLGTGMAKAVWKALRDSEAAKSGLLEDLEDTILLIEGISNDVISDITTNIIRRPLIEYTQRMCKQYGIPMEDSVDSGALWDQTAKRWSNEFVELPVTRYGKVLLVPKAIVRRRMEYDEQEYYRHYILPYLMEAEMNANTQLVRLLKSGMRRVYKKDVAEKYGGGKRMVLRETLRHPQILDDYRRAKKRKPRRPLGHYDLADSEIGGETPDWDELIQSVVQLPTGKADASRYEDAIERLLSALFYPSLADPVIQHEIHDRRKRIDITYTNMARHGFFEWLAQHYPAPHIFVECKNYGKEVGNPELDQLSGRFSPSRGRVGILVCRGFHDKPLFLRRCRDTAQDDRGYILALDDSDLAALVEAHKKEDPKMEFTLLKDRFNHLIM